MATKPTDGHMDWISDDDTAKYIAPSAAKRLQGWIKEEKPPFQYFNWAWRLIDRWLQYFEDATDEEAAARAAADAAHAGNTANPHAVTKAQVGLSNVLNLQCQGPYDLTITAVSGTWTTARARAIFYQDPSGGWRMRFNINGSISPAASSLDLRFTGLSFPTISNGQAISARTGSVPILVCAGISGYAGVNQLVAYAASAQSEYIFSGDVELASQPTGYF
jgi:hypothetical protein